MLLLVTLTLGVFGDVIESHGPVFLIEPPARLTFSNTTGSQVSCSAHGAPTPHVDWLLHDGQTVSAVPGLRQSLGNGTLYFPPFRAEDYRKSVHATVYRCRASNLAGTVLSRDVHVRAVVNQHYEVQVYRTHVIAGNTAVLGCVIPPSVKEHVTVTSWTRDDSILLPGSNMGGRMIVTFGTGELNIRSARIEDGLSKYSCLTIHSLTQERKRSAPATLTVTEATGSMPPRLVPSVQTTVSADQETPIHLTCAAQGNPPPTYEWFKEVDGHLQAVASSSRIEPSQDVLHIRRLKTSDTGRWVCKASNHFGEQRLDIQLIVNAHLEVHVLPQIQIINSGEKAVLNCSISGSPIGRILWYKNGELLNSELGSTSNVRFESDSLMLVVDRVSRYDRGMYQCVVQNEREMAQGSSELRLGDAAPELQSTFMEQSLRPGNHASMRCSATGSPPPHFRWFLDGEVLSDLSPTHRYTISQYVDQTGDVVSHFNISLLRIDDGGRYTCKAVNSLGSTEHSARLNIYGPPFIRSLGPVKAVAGADVTLYCPYSGYPITPVRWERHDQELPLDVRHRLEEDGGLTITRLDPGSDSGFYTCSVANHEGDIARREIQLVVHSPPVLEPFSFPSSLQEGGRAQVTCYVTSGDMPVHFTWFKDSEPISASLQVEERAAEFYSMLIFKEVSSRHRGAYTCVASNAAARANYTAQLMVKVSPQWIVEPQDTSTLLGNPVTLQCVASGFPNPQITWLKARGSTIGNYQPFAASVGKIEILGNGSLWIAAASPSDEGYYLCRASNGIGSGIGKVVYLGVNEPVRFDSALKNVSTRRGNSVSLVCDAYGDTPVQLVWTFNGNRLDHNNNYRYTISNMNMENGLKSQVSIMQADREDSGLYKCLAENVFGSSEHVINLIVQERPDPPTLLEVIEVGSRSVRLAWRRPFDGNSPISGYLVQYQIVGTGKADHQRTTYNLTLPANSLSSFDDHLHRESALVNGLQPATVYTLRMLAVNSIENSPFTESVVVKTQEEEPSGAPQNVRVESVGSSDLTLSWVFPLRNTWNGELLGYIVTWNENGGLWNNSRKMTIKGWATTKAQITGLKKFTRYDVNVCAFNSVSSGPPSPTVLATTKEGVPEASPQDPQCSQISSQSMKVSWTPPPPETHAGVIQGYKVFYRPLFTEYVDVPTTGEIKRTPGIETYLHGLHKFTNYSIKVLAFTSAGDGVLSSTLFCTTDEDLPGPPAAIKALALTGGSILVSWLAPSKPNGRISQYTVYSREAGRIGKHVTHIIRLEDMEATARNNGLSLICEVRGLTEEQLYEFWVTATTGTGEGDSTAIVRQTTNSRAPSRIASFDQILRAPVNAKVMLPCLAVGNPTPRTRWIHRDRPVTFSTFYQVTPNGHLRIHSVDQSLEGNYTCSAKNLFGDDNITYVLFVIMPPSAPSMEIQFVTTTSIRLQWTQPEDGGANIQSTCAGVKSRSSYSLHIKHDSGDWRTIDLSPEASIHMIEGLRCGSLYHVYMVAHNRVGSGSPSPILSVHTKGTEPGKPRDKDLIVVNSTSVRLNLADWPDGGCPISRFSIQYREHGTEDWVLVSSNYLDSHIVVQDLAPATWYQVQVMAQNDAGISEILQTFATTTLAGAHLLAPPVSITNTTARDYAFSDILIVVSAIGTGIFLFGFLFWFAFRYLTCVRQTECEETDENPRQEVHCDKTAERDNKKNCQQVYTSSPVKKSQKIPDDVSGMYEISPYATFSVPSNNPHGRSMASSTLDYNMHFKTFGHLDDDAMNARDALRQDECDLYQSKPSGGKHTWHKHRYCGSEGLYSKFQEPVVRENVAIGVGDTQNDYTMGQKKIRLRSNQIPNRGDSESDETSGSPCTESALGGPSLVPTYHLPVKPPRELFRPDSSTESYEISPPIERRHGAGHRTPHHVPPFRRHRPTSSSSSEEEYLKKKSEPSTPTPPPPPNEFLDSRELSEAECDRDLRLTKMSIELTSLISRYHQQKEQERKEFTIYV